MKGSQLDGVTYMKPKPMTRKTIVTFTKTMMLLKRVDSWIPTTSSVVSNPMSIIAGILMIAPLITSVCVPSTLKGALTSADGRFMPTISRMNELK